MPNVLFVCSGNFYRSRFAELYFNARAEAAGLPWRAESRGFRLHPQNIGPISRHAVEGLKRLGLAPPSPIRSPCVLEQADLERAARVVAVKETEHRPMMQTYFPEWVERVEYWQIDDVDCSAPETALEHLRVRLDLFLVELAISPTPDA